MQDCQDLKSERMQQVQCTVPISNHSCSLVVNGFVDSGSILIGDDKPELFNPRGTVVVNLFGSIKT